MAEDTEAVTHAAKLASDIGRKLDKQAKLNRWLLGLFYGH